MAIEKLDEFARDGQKSMEGLTLTTGFLANLKPARQWFNYLFNTLTKKVNELIDQTNSDADVIMYCPIPYPSTVVPKGYIAMKGQEITQDQYPKLYALYGSKLPDLRGQFIRGLDSERGLDPERVILSEKGDAIRNITGSIGFHDGGLATPLQVGGSGSMYSTGATFDRYMTAENNLKTYKSSGTLAIDASKQVPTADENRPRNIAFHYIVKEG